MHNSGRSGPAILSLPVLWPSIINSSDLSFYYHFQCSVLLALPVICPSNITSCDLSFYYHFQWSVLLSLLCSVLLALPVICPSYITSNALSYYHFHCSVFLLSLTVLSPSNITSSALSDLRSISFDSCKSNEVAQYTASDRSDRLVHRVAHCITCHRLVIE